MWSRSWLGDGKFGGDASSESGQGKQNPSRGVLLAGCRTLRRVMSPIVYSMSNKEPKGSEVCSYGDFSLCSFLFSLFPFLLSPFSFPFSLFSFSFSLFSFLFSLFPFPFSLSPFPFSLFSLAHQVKMPSAAEGDGRLYSGTFRFGAAY